MNKKQLNMVMKERKINTLLRRINGVRLAIGYSKALFTEEEIKDICKELKNQEYIQTGLFEFRRFGKNRVIIIPKFNFYYVLDEENEK